LTAIRLQLRHGAYGKPYDSFHQSMPIIR